MFCRDFAKALARCSSLQKANFNDIFVGRLDEITESLELLGEGLKPLT